MQSWGGFLPLASSVANVTSSGNGAFTIEFYGRVLSASGAMSLRNLTVIRYPGR
jgi:hypothetical protein